MERLSRLPLFLLLMGTFSVSAIVPAGVALRAGDHHDARTFFYSGILGLVLTAFVALALANRPHQRDPLHQLLALLAAFVALPALLAVPFYEAVLNTAFLSAYFEMVSCLTTTGATLYDAARLSDAEHLWRAQVGWFGGLIMWIAAAAILAPLTLGGFEVTASGEPGQSLAEGSAAGGFKHPVDRLLRSIRVLTPIYAGLTAALCVMLLVAGDPPLVAVSHAMGVMATSGITPLALSESSASGLAGEMILFCFLFFGLSRLTFSGDTTQTRGPGLWRDPEFRLGLVIVAAVPLTLFLRHWIAAFDAGGYEDVFAGLRALWGALFTSLSFLVTAGYVSADWSTAQGWSGLSTPGIILGGLALMGGGVATTAGGVKLLRVYALYLNGAREIERLVHPSSVGRSPLVNRRIRREGAFIAWVFFMLFAIMLAAFSVTLSLFGLSFEPALILTVSVLTNTGPLVTAGITEAVDLLGLAAPVKLLLCAGMVLGRLELLAIIVMLSPDIWRD
ncbi:TrkH family potassium uptake protein [Citreimonas salinaria]|uniref:Trk system potassium uptake protein TrkH n=1 Tax=Citreimonas salinaria TaxID=321339 RepID=A0A1H3GB05_9RHOB|nr:potassium transporter TrkG [Citreimonas salinaria]SDX99509.1 trk system potassium uptake protein TrkH [Citreimonas salinaria]